MSATMILEGEFYNEVVEGESTKGWTIRQVQSGYTAPDSKEHGLAWVWAIRNDVRTATPTRMRYAQVADWIQEARWNKVPRPLRPIVEIDDLPEDRQKKICQVENNRLKLIQPLVDLGHDGLWSHIRRPVMTQIAAESGKSDDYIWQLICAYWQFGGSCGLRPRAILAGQMSVHERVVAAEKKARSAIVGRAEASAFFKVYKTGRKPGPKVLEGKPMDFTDVKRCRLGAKKFLFKQSPDGSLRYNWDAAYTGTLDALYGYKEDGKANPLVPSLDQFKTAVRSDPEFDNLSVRIVGKYTAIRSRRQQKDTTRFETLGPGHVVQIDDVKFKVKIVDPLTRLVIGDARGFVGIDTWAKCAVGFHDRLGESDYEGVKELYVNINEDKAEFFKKHGVPVDPKYFPLKGVYKYTAADGGPVGGSLGNIVPMEFCDLSTMAAYRPDFKPDIESLFHAYLIRIASKLPGYSRVDPRAAGVDADTLACLTMADFRRIFWQFLEVYNARVLASYLPEEALRFPHDERPENSPYALASWGLLHLAGCFRAMPEDQIRRKLLRKDKGTLTQRNGIQFKKLHYFIDDDTEYRLRSEKVEIGYSRNYVQQIYVWLNGKCHTASLHGEEAATFGDKTFDDVEREKSFKEVSAGGTRSNQLKLKVKGSRLRRETVENAEAAKDAAYPNKAILALLTKATTPSENRQNSLKQEQRDAGEADRAAFPPKIDQSKDAPSPAPAARKLSMKELRQKALAQTQT